jgi:hypothetical protein
VLSVVQAALVFHARGIATAAAQEGLRAARMASGSAAAGQDRATEFLSETAGDLLVNVTVSANRGADDALVTVRGRVLSVVPGIQLPAAATAAGPVERFAQDGATP